MNSFSVVGIFPAAFGNGLSALECNNKLPDY